MARVLDVLTADAEYGEVCERLLEEIGPVDVKHWRFRSWDAVQWSKLAKNRSTPLLLIARLKDLPATQRPQQRPASGRPNRYLIFTEGMPVESLPSRMARLNIRDDSRLHVSTASDCGQAAALIRRTISGASTSNNHRIVDAWWEGDQFVILSATFERLAVPLARLGKFIGQDQKSLRQFEIDPDGSFVYWPHADVHFGWFQFLQLVDPAAVVSAQAKKRQFNVRYGAAIKRQRESRDLRQSDIPGLTPRQVGRIESGQCRATVSALRKLAAAHGLEMSDYLAALAGHLN